MNLRREPGGEEWSTAGKATTGGRLYQLNHAVKHLVEYFCGLNLSNHFKRQGTRLLVFSPVHFLAELFSLPL